MAQTYYEQAFRDRIHAIYPKGDILAIHLLPENIAHNILQEILETGCQSGNYSNIEIAHEALSCISPEWLLDHLPKVAPICLFKELEWQEWEFRRLAEMLHEQFPDSFEWLVNYAKSLNNREVDDAILDFQRKD